MTVVELADFLTALIDTAHMDEGETKARNLTTIPNYRNAILDEFTLVKQQRDGLLAALEKIDSIGAGVPFVETGSPSAMSERLFECREVARVAIAYGEEK